MLARWNLKTTPEGTSVRYDNLRDQVSMECGTTDMDGTDLLQYILNETGGGAEVVMVDGKFAAMLMPAETDRRHWLTGTNELQG